MAKKKRLKDVGSNLSREELQKLSRATGKNPLSIMSQALNKGITLGSSVVKAYNTPGGLGNYRYQGTPSNLEPLKGLSIGGGNVYGGASTYTTPSTRSREGGYSPGSVSYNPIVMPKSVVTGGGMSAPPQPTGLTYKGKPIQDGVTYQLNDAGTAVVGKVADGLSGIGWTTNAAGDRVLGNVGGGGDGGGDGTTTTTLDNDDQLLQIIKDLMGGDMGASTADMPSMEEFSDITAAAADDAEMDPLQLLAIGRAYGADAIRARQRNRKARSQYRRGLGIMGAVPTQMANMAIGGGVTL